MQTGQSLPAARFLIQLLNTTLSEIGASQISLHNQIFNICHAQASWKEIQLHPPISTMCDKAGTLGGDSTLPAIITPVAHV